MTAQSAIRSVRERRELVADLARALSLAANIDVTLVRTLRRALFERADVTTEVDLWSSPLVAMRSGRDIALRADVQAVFWDELREDRGELERCAGALAAARAGGRPLVELEEKLIYLAIKEDRTAIEEQLSTVIKAMLEEPQRRRDLAAWSARVLTRLPAMVRECEPARVLGTAAASWVAIPAGIAAEIGKPESVRLADQLCARRDRLPVAIRRVGDTLEVGGDPIERSVRLEIPIANPVLIVDEDRTYRIDLRGLTKIEISRPTVMLGTSDGQRWLLGPEQARPNIEAIVSMSVGSGTGVAYLVAPGLAVTSARHLAAEMSRGSYEWKLDFRGLRIGGKLVALDADADIALLALDGRLAALPLELRRDVAPGGVWQVVVPSSALAVLKGTIASVSPAMTLRVLGEQTERWNLPGMPVFSGDKVIGHLRGEPPRDGEIAITPAGVIESWLEWIRAEVPDARDIDTGAIPGSRPPQRSLPVLIHLPEQVSTAGYLGVTVTNEGGVRRFRSHQWGTHEVKLIGARERIIFNNNILIIWIVLRDHRNADPWRELTLTIFGNARTPFAHACRAAARRYMREPSPRYDFEEARAPGPSMPDLQVEVHRLPEQPKSHAYRRAVQFIVDVLHELDAPFLRRLVRAHLRIPGSGALDLAEAQRRVHDASGDDEVDLLWIDPETDIVELALDAGTTESERAACERAAAALGGRIEEKFPLGEERDPISGRFGISPVRNGRRLQIEYRGETAYVTVASDVPVDRPLRGYVAFYHPTEIGQVISTRVRAAEGVAGLELRRYARSYSIGAIVEDDGIMLEGFVDVELLRFIS